MARPDGGLELVRVDRRRHELRSAGGEVVGALEPEGSWWRSRGTLLAGDGRTVLARAAILKRELLVVDESSGEPFARVRHGYWRGGATIWLGDGQRLTWSRRRISWRRSERQLADASGETLVRVRRGDRRRLVVDCGAGISELPQPHLVALLACRLFLDAEAGAAAAGSAAAGGAAAAG